MAYVFDIDRVAACIKFAGLDPRSPLDPNHGPSSWAAVDVARLEQHYGLPGTDAWSSARYHHPLPDPCGTCGQTHPKHMTLGERIRDIEALQHDIGMKAAEYVSMDAIGKMHQIGMQADQVLDISNTYRVQSVQRRPVDGMDLDYGIPMDEMRESDQ